MEPLSRWKELLGFEGSQVQDETIKDALKKYKEGECRFYELDRLCERLPKPGGDGAFEGQCQKWGQSYDELYRELQDQLSAAKEFQGKLAESAPFFDLFRAEKQNTQDAHNFEHFFGKFTNWRTPQAKVKELVSHDDEMKQIIDEPECWNAIVKVEKNCFLRWVVASKAAGVPTVDELGKFLKRLVSIGREEVTSETLKRWTGEQFVQRILEPLAHWDDLVLWDKRGKQVEVIDRSLKDLHEGDDSICALVHSFLVQYWRLPTFMKMKKAFLALKGTKYPAKMIPMAFLDDRDVKAIMNWDDGVVSLGKDLDTDDERLGHMEGILKNATVDEIADQRILKMDVQAVHPFVVFWNGVSDLLTDYCANDNRKAEDRALFILALLQADETKMIDHLREDATNGYCTDEQRRILQMLLTVIDVLNLVHFEDMGLADVCKTIAEQLGANKVLMDAFDRCLGDFIGVINNNTTMGVVPEVRNGELVREQRLMEEYRLVEELREQKLSWKVSLADGICLIRPDGQVDVSFHELSAAVNKLNVAMASAKDTDGIASKMKREAIQAVKDVVSFFQKAERLRTALIELRKLYSDSGDNSYVFSTSQAMAHLESEISKAEGFCMRLRSELGISALRSPEVKAIQSLFTFEDLCHLYHLISKARSVKQGRGLPRDEQLIEDAAAIIRASSMLWNSWPNSVDAVKKLVDDKEGWSQDEMLSQLTKSLSGNMGSDMRICRDEAHKITMDGQNNIERLVKVPTVLFFRAKPAQISIAILYFFLHFQGNDPRRNQLLIADWHTPKSAVESFMESFLVDFNAPSTTDRRQKKLYILANPDQLAPSAFLAMADYVHKKIERGTGTQAQLLILTSEQSPRVLKEFSTLNLHIVREVQNYQPYLQSRFSSTSDRAADTLGGRIKAFFIYDPKPRVGKTHCVMKHMYEHEKQHLYYRILVDKGTTLAQLIAALRKAPRVKDYTTCIHFNVDGHVDAAFCNHILELLLFGSLKDGVNIPYIYEAHDLEPVLYFEFGAIPWKNKETFINDVFPLGIGMTEIQIPANDKEFFSLTEYRTVQVFHQDYHGADKLFKVQEFPNSRTHLACAAAIVLTDDDNNQLNYLPTRNKLSCMRYEDFYRNYETVVRALKPDQIYDLLRSVFENDRYVPDAEARRRAPLISQIGDISLMISAFSSLILSRNRFETELALGLCTYKVVVRMLIRTAIENCGMAYKPPPEDQGEGHVKQNESQDEDRLNDVKQFMSQFTGFLVVRDPGGEANNMDYKIVSTTEDEFDNVNGWDIDWARDGSDSSAKAILEKDYFLNSHGWHELQAPEKGKEMFDLLSSILNLEFHEKNKTNNLLKTIDAREPTLAVMYKFTKLIIEWNGQNEQIRQEARRMWTTNRLYTRTEMVVAGDASQEFKDFTNAEFERLERKRVIGPFAGESERRLRLHLFGQDMVLRVRSFLKELQFCYNESKKEFDLEQDQLSIDCLIQRFEEICRDKEKGIGSKIKQTPFLSYALTGHNVRRIMRLLCRVHAKVPVILMGETGSGKTYTLNFLASVAGPNVRMERLTVDGGFSEQMLRDYIERKLSAARRTRANNLVNIIAEHRGRLPDGVVKEFLGSLERDLHESLQQNGPVMTAAEAQEKARCYVNNHQQFGADLHGYLNFHIDNIFKELDSRQDHILFFFDEVNTAPCQWFLKEIMIDRYLDGQTLPSFVSFICAVNPYRKIPEAMKKKFQSVAAPPADDLSPEKELRELVYKVRKMPESFIPFVMPADPSREIGSCPDPVPNNLSETDQILSTKPLSEFDMAIRQVVGRNTQRNPDKFVDNVPDGSRWEKWGDKNHFWVTDRFTTDLGVKFFQRALFGSMKEDDQYNTAHEILGQVEDFLSGLCIFGCRFMSTRYQDSSLTSIREAVNLIHLTRYMFRFGLVEPLPRDLIEENSAVQERAKKVVSRLRRAIIMALTAVFWIRLTDSKNERNQPSDREDFDSLLIQFWTAKMDELRRGKRGTGGHSAVFDEFYRPLDQTELSDVRNAEFHGYFGIFVDRCDGISANQAFIENLWCAYTCIINGIPLWIIGKPGTSKSLAVNTVLKKLFYRKSADPKVRECVPLIYQMHMCSELSTSEAILGEVEKLVMKGRLIRFPYVIHIQILEELGHADLSPYLPLKCLHNIIDNGFEYQYVEDGEKKSVSVPVVMIGISNYNTDRAKLNRGILAFRDELSEEQTKKTAIDIATSTYITLQQASSGQTLSEDQITRQSKVLIDTWGELIRNVAAKFQIVSSEENRQAGLKNSAKFVGLRDFYGLIKAIAALIQSSTGVKADLSPEKLEIILERNFSGLSTPERVTEFLKRMGAALQLQHPPRRLPVPDLVNENLNEPDRHLQSPLMRHIMIATKNLDALHLLKLTKREEWRNALYLFGENMTDVPDSEWTSNDLRKFARAMLNDQGRVVFVGRHPCFDSLYDVFNMYYETFAGSKMALVSYAGGSFKVSVGEDFRVIVIVNEPDYHQLSAPFLNRFEKFHLSYESSTPDTSDLAKLKAEFHFFFGRPDWMDEIGCCSDEYVQACFLARGQTFLSDFQKYDLWTYFLLACQPSSLFYHCVNRPEIVSSSPLQDNDFVAICVNSLRYNSVLHSSLANLVVTYHDYVHGQRPSVIHEEGRVTRKIFDMWKDAEAKIPGIQTIAMVSSITGIEEGMQRIYAGRGSYVHLDLGLTYGLRTVLKHKLKEEVEKREAKSLLLILSTRNGDEVVSKLPQIQYLINRYRTRARAKAEKNTKCLDELHVLIVIEMENRPKKLKLVPSLDWPVLYMDTCVSAPICQRMKGDIALPLELSDLLFGSIRDLIDSDESVLDYDKLERDVNMGLREQYTNSEWMFVENWLSIGPVKDNIRANLLHQLEGQSRFQELADNDDWSDFGHWSVLYMHNISSPPTSLLNYLGQRLQSILVTFYAGYLHIGLSGVQTTNNEENLEDILTHLMYCDPTPLDWALTQQSLQIINIERRYLCGTYGLFKFYAILWQRVLDSPPQSEDDAVRILEQLISGTDEDRERLLDCMASWLDYEQAWTNNKTREALIAAYLLAICPDLHVDHPSEFADWARRVGDMATELFIEQAELVLPYMIGCLACAKCVSFFRELTYIYKVLNPLDELIPKDEEGEPIRKMHYIEKSIVLKVAPQLLQHEFRDYSELVTWCRYIFPPYRTMAELNQYIDEFNEMAQRDNVPWVVMRGLLWTMIFFYSHDQVVDMIEMNDMDSQTNIPPPYSLIHDGEIDTMEVARYFRDRLREIGEMGQSLTTEEQQAIVHDTLQEFVNCCCDRYRGFIDTDIPEDWQPGEDEEEEEEEAAEE